MVTSSSQDRHPSAGARFVFTRRAPALVYDVEVFLADRRRLTAMLHWDETGVVVDPPLSDAWAQAETLKLARVLRKNPKAVLSRWRG